MDDPNITMEEYISLVEEKARKHRSVETEFPAIVFNDNLTSCETLFCEPTISSLNYNEIDFRISFDESDDEDYTVVFDKNSFSYKIISTNDLKTDSEIDIEKFNVPSFPSPEPKVNCIDDLDFFKDFENEFPAIVYNDALTSKSNFSTEPTLRPQHIDEFDLKDETSLSEYDEEAQNVLYFNDLFPFNIIYPDDLMLGKDNDDNKIDIVQSSGGNVNTQRQKKFLEASHDKINKIFNEKSFIMKLNVNIMVWNYLVNAMLLNLIKNLYVPFGIPFDPKRYYKDGVYTRMLRRPRDRVYSLAELGGGARRCMSWRQFILALGLHTAEEMESVGFDAYWAVSTRQIPDKGDLRDYWIWILSTRDFLGTTPSYTSIRDPILRLCHRMIAYSIPGRSQAPEKVTVTDLFYLRGLDVGSVNIPYLLARYLRRFATGRKSGALILGSQFVARLAKHFGLLT
ncbi:hypothetical protein Tco_1064867, partial [Tanacetum coccineum]